MVLGLHKFEGANEQIVREEEKGEDGGMALQTRERLVAQRNRKMEK